MIFLLSDPSPCLRWLTLRALFRKPADDPEVLELAALRSADPLVTDLLVVQEEDGRWKTGTLPGSASGKVGHSPVLATALALARLGYLGFDRSHPAVARGAEYLFSQQQADGSWALPGSYAQGENEEGEKPARERYSMMPLQTTFPLRALASCGYAEDARAEKAYDWLLAQRLPDGAFPTGVAAGVYGYVAGYRRLPHSRWGCRSNTTGALICLALHPVRCRSAEAQRALDHLLGRETREAYTLGYEIARLVGAEEAHGFITFFARFDLALILDLCWRVGASKQDARVASLVQFVRSLQGSYGLWDYPPRPQATRWVTFDLLRSLSHLDEAAGVDWVNVEALPTPFQPYPTKRKRF